MFSFFAPSLPTPFTLTSLLCFFSSETWRAVSGLCVSATEQVCDCSVSWGVSHCGVEGVYRGEAECENVTWLCWQLRNAVGCWAIECIWSMCATTHLHHLATIHLLAEALKGGLCLWPLSEWLFRPFFVWLIIVWVQRYSFASASLY